jgi:hypothetical protein
MNIYLSFHSLFKNIHDSQTEMTIQQAMKYAYQLCLKDSPNANLKSDLVCRQNIHVYQHRGIQKNHDCVYLEDARIKIDRVQLVLLYDFSVF